MSHFWSYLTPKLWHFRVVGDHTRGGDHRFIFVRESSRCLYGKRPTASKDDKEEKERGKKIGATRQRTQMKIGDE